MKKYELNSKVKIKKCDWIPKRYWNRNGLIKSRVVKNHFIVYGIKVSNRKTNIELTEFDIVGEKL
jgi:hypothetical protein